MLFRSDLHSFLNLCEYLGVPIAEDKTVGPHTVLQFAGITLDTVKQEARLPDEKLQKCYRLLHDFYKRRKVTLKELQSLLGLLNFTCSVVVPGRAFLRRMIDLTKGARRRHHHIRLTKEVKHFVLSPVVHRCSRIQGSIGVVIATKSRYYLFYLQQCISALRTVLPKSFTGAFSSNSSLDVREV